MKMKSGSDHKDGIVGRGVRQGAGSVEHGVDEVVKVVDRFVQFSIWFVVALEGISVTKHNVC